MVKFLDRGIHRQHRKRQVAVDQPDHDRKFVEQQIKRLVDQMQVGEKRVEQTLCSEYLFERISYYDLERRWQTPFWVRRRVASENALAASS